MIAKLQDKQIHSFEWIDVVNPTTQELLEIAEKYSLHTKSVEDCLEPEHLPKYEEIDNVVFVILRVYDENAKPNADNIQGLTRKIAIFCSNDFFVTIHRTHQPFLDEIHKKVSFYKKPINSLQLLTKVIDYSLHTYQPPADKIEDLVDFYEEKIFLKTRLPDLLKTLYMLKRKASVSKKMITLTREIIYKLSEHVKGPYMQDLKDSYVQMDIVYDEIMDSINNLTAIYLSVASQKTNEVMRVLTIFSVFFMPLTFIVGVYGMNFKYMPELEVKNGYYLTWLVMVIVTIVVFLWFKRRKWL
ncbi:magnesium transporter CorA family protein [Solitalea koreensis]|uniref:Magnesium transporter n=1 Tax=Solitalea koreensis TaxID=543615 RepID=A0A521CZZ3_9SPHI|nr:CorA family divalent cation transporter [Solitalea koreensis]SMO64978.1 magnesium transporter [Solitalea koreensis]